MSDFKYTLKATIPTVQYGNVQPELHGDDMAKLEKEMQELWAKYGDKPLPVNDVKTTATKLVEHTCIVSGAKVKIDSDHNYDEGWMGGSTFKSKFIKPFDIASISSAMAAKVDGVEADDIVSMWKDKGAVASGLGTAIHQALENYERYKEKSELLGKDYHLTDNPFIAPIVEEFAKEHDGEDVILEAFVADEGKKLCGFIDRLKIVDKDTKTVRVQDYKTDTDITKRVDILPPFKGTLKNTKLDAYWIQLSVYAWILEQNGYTVEGLDIFHITTEKGKPVIHTYSHDVLELHEAFKEVGR